MTPESQLPQRNQQPDPLAAMQAMSGQSLAQAGGPPSVQDQAEGVRNTLKSIMGLAVAAATSAPPLAEKMKAVRQAAMEAILVVQNMADSGSESGGY